MHFSVPHLPFVVGPDGYDPPLDPLRTSPDIHYVRQLQFVDRLVGNVVAMMRASESYEGSQTPFIVKMPGQQTRTDVTVPVRGETLLKTVLERSCRPGESAGPA